MIQRRSIKGTSVCALIFALMVDPLHAASSPFKTEALSPFPAAAFAPAGNKDAVDVRHTVGGYLRQLQDEISRLYNQGPATTPIDATIFYATESRMKSMDASAELIHAWKILFKESTPEQLRGFTLWMQSYFRAMYDQGWGYQEFIDRHLPLLTRWLGKDKNFRGLLELITRAANDVRLHLTLGHFDEIASRPERGQPLRIVYVTPEARPYSEKGGLAGVAGPLPQAINRLNAWSTTITLAYDDPIMRRESPQGAPLVRRPFILANRPVQFDIVIDGEVHPCTVELAGSNASYEANPPFFFLRDLYPNVSKRLTHLPYGAHHDAKSVEELQVKQAVFLSEGAILLTKLLIQAKWMSAPPDAIIAHDWPASLVGPYLKTKYAGDPDLKGVKSGFFMHNNISAYQGNFSRSYFHFLNLAGEHLHGFLYEAAFLEGPEIYLAGWREQLSFVRAALFHADIVLTTSQTFAHMAQSKIFGYGLESLLQIKAGLGRLIGIPHGFSYDLGHYPVHSETEARNVLAIKRQAKKILLEETGLWAAIEKASRHRLRDSPTLEADLQIELAAELDKPVEIMVSRLDVYQKGLDLLQPEFEGRSNPNPLRKIIFEGDSHIIILGDPTGGSPELVNYVSNLARRHPDQLVFYPKFREPLTEQTFKRLSGLFPGRDIRSMADLMMAGGDIFWMLSRIEPFGISVQEAHERGMVVIGTTNGGPAEQIKDYRVDPAHGNGILFGQLFHEVDEELKRIGKPAIFEPLSKIDGYQNEFSPEAFAETRRQLLYVYAHHPDIFDGLRLNAWNRRDTWEQPARDHLIALARLFGRQDLVDNPEKFDQTHRPALIPGVRSAA